MLYGHRPCGSRDITYLFCQVILQDHLIKRFCDFMKGNSLYERKQFRGYKSNLVVVIESF